MNPMPHRFDGVMLCNGPSLEEDWSDCLLSKGIKDNVLVASVNYSVMRIRIPQNVYVYHFNLDPSIDMMMKINEHRDGARIMKLSYHEKFYSEDMAHKHMCREDWPHLINLGYTMFTALHFMICVGCSNIIACGCDLKHWPDGWYNNGSQRLGNNIFNEHKRLFEDYTRGDLKRMGVMFWSRAFQEPE